VKEKVSGGFFSEEKHELVQQVRFAILGKQFGYARWEAGMLNLLIEVRNNIAAQHERIPGDMRRKLPAK